MAKNLFRACRQLVLGCINGCVKRGRNQDKAMTFSHKDQVMDREAIESAYRKIESSIVKTPLVNSPSIDRAIGIDGRIFFKCENRQITGSYKARGALHAMMKKMAPALARSSGNFAQALAWAGHKLNLPVTIVMPRDCPLVKIEGTKKWGAEVVLTAPSYDAQYRKIDQIQKQHPDWRVYSPYDDWDVIAGQGTIALEILEQLPSLDAIVGPIGGGGLMSGCSVYLKNTKKKVKTIGVEPAGASDYYLSRKEGRLIAVEAKTIAEGLRTPKVGQLNWPLLNRCVDEAVVVSDHSIIKAMHVIKEELNLVVEPSGAAAFAALIENNIPSIQGDVAVVISGGNIDDHHFEKFLSSFPGL